MSKLPQNAAADMIDELDGFDLRIAIRCLSDSKWVDAALDINQIKTLALGVSKMRKFWPAIEKLKNEMLFSYSEVLKEEAIKEDGNQDATKCNQPPNVNHPGER